MNDICINDIKKKGIIKINQLLEFDINYTKQGSISYLLYGKKFSEYSINNNLKKFAHFLINELIVSNSDLEIINLKLDKNLIFKDKKNKIIYYRELKSNIDFDISKINAINDKYITIQKNLNEHYPDYKINYGILIWTIYNSENLSSEKSNIIKYEKNGIKIDHMENFLNNIDIKWSIDDYYNYFREIGNIINNYH